MVCCGLVWCGALRGGTVQCGALRDGDADDADDASGRN